MKTVTFISTRFSENNFQDSYPTSIKLKGQCDDVVESNYLKNCEDLRSGRKHIFLLNETEEKYVCSFRGYSTTR